MPKPFNPKMKEIALKYKTGQYRVNELSRMYKIDKATISRYFKKNNIEINQHAKEAIESLSYGYSKLHNILENDKINQQNENKTTIKQQFNQQCDNIKNKDIKIDNMEISTIESQNIELANEIIEIVKQKNPQFARGFHALSALMIKRSSEILQKPDISSGDIANISRAVNNMNDTLGVFPKMPTIAQQFNIGGNIKNNKKETKPLDLKIEFIDAKGVND